jgi:hypothetical protein
LNNAVHYATEAVVMGMGGKCVCIDLRCTVCDGYVCNSGCTGDKRCPVSICQQAGVSALALPSTKC